MSAPVQSSAAGNASTDPPVNPPLDTRGFLRWMWRQFTSMRVALILLFLLAIASIPGSILPQRGTNPLLVDEWIADSPTWGPILDSLGFFDVYAAPWFAAVYLLLFLSLIGCVLPRVGAHWRELRTPPPPAPRYLDRFDGTTTWVDDRSPLDIASAARTALKGWRIREKETPAGVEISAERGYLKETGNLVFHIALIGILIGVAVGGLLGWRGNVIVREGSGFSNTLTQYDAWGGSRLSQNVELAPFSFTLKDFRVEFERGEAQSGAPRLFEADVEYRPTPDAEPQDVRIEVNYPLVADGAKVFLVGHGYAPIFIVRDAQGDIVFNDAVPFLPQDGAFTSTGVVKAPDANPQLGFQGLFLPTTALDDVRGPHSIFPDTDDPSVFFSAWKGDLGLDSGLPQSVYSIETEGMEQIGLRALVPGQTWEFPDGSIEFVGIQRWASFQIAHDPGKELALIASVLAMLGLMASLFIRRRRIWVRIQGGETVSTVAVAGLAREDGGEVQPLIEEIVSAIRTEDQCRD